MVERARCPARREKRRVDEARSARSSMETKKGKDRVRMCALDVIRMQLAIMMTTDLSAIADASQAMLEMDLFVNMVDFFKKESIILNMTWIN